jgi:hypothetical protein
MLAAIESDLPCLITAGKPEMAVGDGGTGPELGTLEELE